MPCGWDAGRGGAVEFRIPGRIIERTVNVGDRVRPGQVIARLEDGTPLHLRLQNSDRVAVPAPGTRVGLAVEAGAARLLAD